MNMFFRFEVGSLSVCMPLKRSKEKITFFFIINYVYLTIDFRFDVCHLPDLSSQFR